VSFRQACVNGAGRTAKVVLERGERWQRVNVPKSWISGKWRSPSVQRLPVATLRKLRLWIEGARHCEYGPMVRFAYGLRKDLLAVSAAVETSWSTGQVEGQINRLKMIKRQMYGRAGFELLRAACCRTRRASAAGASP
jgi:hypothetical protein